jgi:hypothetical protein
MMVPKHTNGYRSATQLDPFDSLLFAAMVHSMANQIEEFRAPEAEKLACAYRLNVQSDGQFFRRGDGWEDFHARSVDLSNEPSCRYVISVDVTDFYNQVSHHRLQNALAGAGISETRSEAAERFLSNFNALHHSRGIPVGPSASKLLAECALADVDDFLLRRRLRHTRYVDDFRIFCSSRETAVKGLHDLSEYLFTAHRLSLQVIKTSVIPVAEFRKKNLENPADLERKELTNQLSELLKLSGDDSGYGPEEVDLNEAETEMTQSTLNRLMNQVLGRKNLPLGLARYVLRRAGALRTRAILERTLKDHEKLLPVLRDLINYWCEVPGKREANQIGEVLRYLITQSPYRIIPFVQYWVLSAFEAKQAFCDKTTALESAENSDAQIRDRMAALLARSYKIVDWVRGKKETWSNTSAWAQRAIIWSSSILPRNERIHWLRPICNYPVASTAAIARAVRGSAH